MTRRSGLGRGLGALIPTEATHTPGSALQELPLSEIHPNQFQPRKHFDEEALSSLVDSIRAVGVLQPVLVRQIGDTEYELIAGERRCRAARRAGLQTIRALVQTVTDATSLEHALVENLHRENLNPLEEAAAYQQLIEDFGVTHDDVAKRVGKSRAAVTNALRLFQLPPTVQRFVQEGRLSAGHGRALLMHPDRELQERLATEAATESLSVRALEERVRSLGDGPGEALGNVEGEEESNERRPSSGASAPVAHRLRPPGVLELEELLATHLNTRVKVDMTSKRGKVIVEFATIEDLERIYRAMVGEPTG